jgi:hypothetical protein
MIQQLRRSKKAHPNRKKKRRMRALAQLKMLTFRIYTGTFACLVYKTQITLYTYNGSRLFSRSYVSSLTVQKNEIIIRPAALFRFPQLLAMSPATFWATFFLASDEIGESPIYMSKKALQRSLLSTAPICFPSISVISFPSDV